MKPLIHKNTPLVRFDRISGGFTLIELLTTVVIIGILAAIAVPGFQRLTETNRLAGATNDVLSDMALARSEAIKRKEGQVVICTSSAGAGCEGAAVGWKDGWVIFWDKDTSGSYSSAAGDVILKIHSSLPTTLATTVSPANTVLVAYNRLGLLQGSAITSLRITSSKVSNSRILCFNSTGRLSLEYDKAACS